MMENFYDKPRTHSCGALRGEHVGQTVLLKGWVKSWRDHGGCLFIDIRDRFGFTQVVFNYGDQDKSFDGTNAIRDEFVIAIEGKVVSRGENVNKNMPTGEIEVHAESFHVLAKAAPLPLQVIDETEATETTRLKYRYLDLRRTPLQEAMILRHKVNQATRRYLDEYGFLEIETPYLTKSTPEGARDFLVPSRIHAGDFYALPQSPQLFKQILMVSGFDRYFQIVRCFRDEALRADRQPEFTQIDCELSFADETMIQDIFEGLMKKLWQEVLGLEIMTPFPKLTYNEAMEIYGVDAPDTRFGMRLNNLNAEFTGCGFKVFASTIEKGNVVKAIRVYDSEKKLSRSFIEKKLEPVVKTYGAKGLAWVRVEEGGGWKGPIAKFFDEETMAKINDKAKAAPESVLLFVADTAAVANDALGHLRKHIAKEFGLIPENRYDFLWITDFPVFDYSEEEERWVSTHHPFTSPKPEDIDKLESAPGDCYARAYDMVLNGHELGGGSVRIHDVEVQRKVFRALQISDEEAKEKFGFLLDALQYGAPPHAGIAFGVDRLIMLMGGFQSLRDVIAFPKTTQGNCLLTDAPNCVAKEQLDELHLAIQRPKE